MWPITVNCYAKMVWRSSVIVMEFRQFLFRILTIMTINCAQAGEILYLGK